MNVPNWDIHTSFRLVRLHIALCWTCVNAAQNCQISAVGGGEEIRMHRVFDRITTRVFDYVLYCCEVARSSHGVTFSRSR